MLYLNVILLICIQKTQYRQTLVYGTFSKQHLVLLNFKLYASSNKFTGMRCMRKMDFYAVDVSSSGFLFNRSGSVSFGKLVAYLATDTVDISCFVNTLKFEYRQPSGKTNRLLSTRTRVRIESDSNLKIAKLITKILAMKYSTITLPIHLVLS